MVGRLHSHSPDRVRITLAAVTATFLGAAVAIEPRIAFTLAGGAAAIAVVQSRLWVGAMLGSVAGLVLLGWGFNNIPMPVASVNIPAVDAVLLVALAGSYPYWKVAVKDGIGRRIYILLIILSVVALGRLAIDVPVHGLTAGRDALYVFEAWAVLVGIAIGGILGTERLNRSLGVFWRIAVLWFLLFPFREVLAEAGPTVGIVRPSDLIAFTNAGVFSAVALFWFAQEKQRTSLIFAGLALVALLMAQVRGMLLAVVITLIVGSLVYRYGFHRSSAFALVASRFAIVAVVGLVVLSILPPLEGRVGERVGIQGVQTQIGTLLGGEGAGAGSLRHRQEAWQDVAATVGETPGRIIFGVGFGPDLFGGFALEGGVDVRKPHNDPLEIWARTGVIGLLPWILLIGSLVVWAVRIAPRYQYGWWLIALQAAIVMSALTQPAFAFAYRGMVYMLLTGAVMGAIMVDRRAKAGPDT